MYLAIAEFEAKIKTRIEIQLATKIRTNERQLLPLINKGL